MNKYEELVYSLIYNCNQELTSEEKQILNQASAIYNTYNQLTEQLGCPLEVVFKALTNGVYYEDVANCMKYMVADLHLNLEGEYVLYFSNEEYLLTKNYKKTWWLREDKSE